MTTPRSNSTPASAFTIEEPDPAEFEARGILALDLSHEVYLAANGWKTDSKALEDLFYSLSVVAAQCLDIARRERRARELENKVSFTKDETAPLADYLGIKPAAIDYVIPAARPARPRLVVPTNKTDIGPECWRLDMESLARSGM